MIAYFPAHLEGIIENLKGRGEKLKGKHENLKGRGELDKGRSENLRGKSENRKGRTEMDEGKCEMDKGKKLLPGAAQPPDMDFTVHLRFSPSLFSGGHKGTSYKYRYKKTALTKGGLYYS
jgi:hypothetical protein